MAPRRTPAKAIVVGRPEVVAKRIERLGLRIAAGRDFEIVNPESDPRYDRYWQAYHAIMERKGVPPKVARTVARTSSTAIAALAVVLGDADAMICGVDGAFRSHLAHVRDIVGTAEGVHDLSALSLLILNKGTYFLTDTYVSFDPSAEEVAEMTVLAAAHIRRFGLEPKIALLSHSSFGSSQAASAEKMRAALRILHDHHPDLEVEGEMHADVALDAVSRARVFPNSRLKDAANLLVLPNLDAANIAFNLVKVLGEGLPVGPILIGTAKPVHILTASVTARGVVNMSAVAAVDAQDRAKDD